MVLLCEKYRPKTVEELIAPKMVKKFIEDIIKKREIPNILMVGSQGIGKT